jgi:imidazolonepropionase-like amidohydrolase
MRHLYQEAAKCVKYGGMSENDALKTITLNGAKQLGLEKRTGSIEVGKDADLAIFNGHPLNGFSRCEMTLVEGEVYFQRSEKLVPFAPAAIGPTPPAKPVPAITPNPAGKYVLTGVTVHPVRGEIVPDAAVVIEKGRVARIIGNISRKEIDFGPGVTVTDLAGLHVYPGMIDAGTVIGLTELGSARETHDYSDSGDFQPDLRAATGVNPDSELIPVTRANGVTTVVTRPTGGVVAGQAALLNLAGWTPAEMTIAEPIGLSVEFPAGNLFFTGDPTAPAVGRALAKRQREEKIRRLKELFRQAAVYEAARKANPASAVNPRLEALVPYARGEQPLIVQAFRKAEIVDALALADELKLKIILSGAADAWKVADELKKRDVPVIVGPVMTMPQENFDRYDAPFTNIARLHAAGVRFCIRSSGGANSRNLPYETAMAVSYGLPPEEGLKAVTLYPAQILGVDKDLGSVEPGKRANLVVTNGDILQPSTQVLSLFIDGKPFAPESKQTRLADRYRQRLAGGAGSREAKTGEEGKE